MRVEHGTREGMVLAEAINPFYSDLDTYHMMASVIDEAVRRVVSVGAGLDRIAGLDNFCWPDPVRSDKTPDGPYKMAQLVRANKALYDVCTAFKVPPISGKDSMKNDSVRGGRKISIPPTVLFSTIAKMDDVRRAVTMSFKKAGDVIYVVGTTKNELGASEYFRMLAEEQGAPANYGGDVPKLDVPLALSIYRAMGEATAAGLLRSSHTPTLGGLAVAFALAAAGGDLGAEIWANDPKIGDDVLFSESNSRFVVTCAPEKAGELESLFNGLPITRVGTVTEARTLKIGGAIDVDVEDLRNAFKKTLQGI
jgi:phosphoribosylformylglycinamidine synthase